MSLDQSAPIATNEFLAWVTQERKHQHTQVMVASLVLTVFMVALSYTLVATFNVAAHGTQLELKNQSDIATLRAVRNAAVTENEVQLCKIVYTMLARQKAIAAILVADPVFIEHRNDPAFVKRQNAAQSLSKEIQASTVPACDGFPASPPAAGQK